MLTALYVMMGIAGVVMIVVFVIVYNKYVKVDTNSTTQKNKKNESSEESATKESYAGDAKSFLEFEELKDYAIDLGNYQYRAIIECSSISYALRTPLEREQIEYGFQSFLNALTYPLVLYVQTRAVDNSKVLKGMQKNADKAIEQFPELKEYSDMYMAHMKELPFITGFPKCKKKYIIIPYDETSDLSELSHKEKEEFCLDELMNRAQICCSELNGIGIKTTILDKKELAKVIYSSFHRNDISIVEDIAAGNLATLMVKGDVYDNIFSSKGKLLSILQETKNKIYTQLELNAETTEDLALYKRIYECFDILTREATYDWETVDHLLELMRQKADELENDRIKMTMEMERWEQSRENEEKERTRD